MSKFRTSILIFGILITVIAASLLTVLVLYATGVIITDPIELVLAVKDEQKVYDGTPLKAGEYYLTSGELLEGHYLQVEFTGSQTDAGVSESDLSVKVVDEKGFDVSKEYAFKTEKGKLSVAPVDITVVLNGGDVMYNGKEVNLNNYEITEGKLVAGHKLAASVPDAKLLNVGDTLPDNVTPLVYDAFDNPVTGNYNVNFELNGAVKVVARPITVKPVGATKIYDGLELVCNDWEITSENKLAPNQTAVVEICGTDFSAAKLTDAGEMRIQIDQSKFKILDENGEEVTGNYEVAYDYDFINIEKRALILTARSGSWVYDGEEHSFETDRAVYLVEGLAAGEKISRVTYSGKITDVGTKLNEITGFEFESGKRSNYSPVYVNGKLEVTPMSITVSARSIFKIYDGKTLGDTLKEDATLDEEDKNFYVVEPSLPKALTLKCENDVESAVDAGSASYKLKNVRIENAAGDDCSDNFDIKLREGMYRIDKKDVTLKLAKVEETYNGRAFDTIDKEKAFEGVTFETGVNLTAADFDLVFETGVFKNAGNYSYSAEFATGSTNAKNYNLTVTPGTFKIKKYEATLSVPENEEKVYDGTLADIKAGEILINGLFGDLETAAVTSVIYETVDKIKTHEVTVKSVTVSFENEDVTSNFEINYAGAVKTVDIAATSLELYVPQYSFKYDWEAYSYPIKNFIGLSRPLVSGDYIEVAESAVSVGGGYVTVSLIGITIKNSKGEDVTSLYAFDRSGRIEGTYTVEAQTY